MDEVQTHSQYSIEELQKEYKQLVYAVSHDLQSPLRVMDGHLHMLVEKIDEDPNVKAHTEALQSSLQQVKNYLHGLIDYSRTLHSEILFKQFSLEDLLEIIKYEMRDSITKSQPEISITANGSFYGDKSLIQKLLSHLLENAIKFQPEGQKAVIEIKLIEKETYTTFTIQDNGIGFDPKWKDRAQELFQILNKKQDYPGNGLGLSICKKIIDMHQGKMEFTTEEGKGCLVEVKIPKHYQPLK